MVLSLGRGATEGPPGRVKITTSLRGLLEEKEFSGITTAEIARNAGVTEALIYKYFKDKRDLLHEVLREYLEAFMEQAHMDLKGIKGALNKLRKLIWTHIYIYATNRVFARILLVEVRSHPDYYKSDTYGLVKEYSQLLLSIIEEGVSLGEIREDLPPRLLRQAVLGAIEQVCLRGTLFGLPLDPDSLTEDLCETLFHGFSRQDQ